MRTTLSKLLCCFVFLAAPLSSYATSVPHDARAPLIIAVKRAPPFAMKTAQGKWIGISIDLWKSIAKDLRLNYRFQETTLTGMLKGVAKHRFDAGVAALTVTADREKVMDFSHPFYTTGLGIATLTRPTGLLGYIRGIVSWQFIKAVVALLLVLLAVGMVIWLLERRKNPDQFSGSPIEGIGTGLWLAAVTMTTVGYGDKAPRSLLGRALVLVWMFVSVITISGFTAAIASSITVGQLAGAVRRPSDLRHVNVVTVTGSSSASYLTRMHVSYRAVQTLADAMDALQAGTADAVVYDKPLLRYMVKQRQDDSLRVLPYTLVRQDYAIALPLGSALRHPLNEALLKDLATQRWRDLIERYLGKH